MALAGQEGVQGMSNVVQFPLTPGAGPRQSGHIGDRILNEPPAHCHAVQFYDDESFLFETVGRFIRAGLDAGEGGVIIATPQHTDGILSRVGKEARDSALEDGRLVLVDAEAMLSRFMVGEQPVEHLFTDAVERVVSSLPESAGPRGGVRAFGEMVDLLWRQGKPTAAVELESLWTRFASKYQIRLLCAYVMRNFYKPDDAEHFNQLCRLHTHVIPTEQFARDGGDVFERLRQISVLEQRARLLQSEVQYRQEVESVLRDALRERERMELELRASIEREREARLFAGASGAVRDVLSTIVGPLETVLTTSRLMTQSCEAPMDSQRLARWAETGARMQRTVEQILALSRQRLAEGSSAWPRQEADLVPIVARAIEEARLARPEAQLTLAADEPCEASVDPERIQLAVGAVLQNATTHGDLERPMAVSVAVRGTHVRISVHNYGPPIDAETLRTLFVPFQKTLHVSDNPARLRLGLYVAERIIWVHGGTLEVSSALQTGTTCEIALPRCH
jgi:signal transduction histidine kinase